MTKKTETSETPIKDQRPSLGVIPALRAIAEERQGYLVKMRTALETGNDEQLKFYARKLCGMDHK